MASQTVSRTCQTVPVASRLPPLPPSLACNTCCSYFLCHLEPTYSILDVACGSGSLTVALASYVPQGSIVGIDERQASLEQATLQPNLPSHCQFTLGTVTSIPFASHSFDVVHAHQVLGYVTDPVQAIRELRRVCKPDGFVAIREADWGSTFFSPSSEKLLAWKALYDQVFRTDQTEPDAGRHLYQWAITAGFQGSAILYSAGSQCYTTKQQISMWSEAMARQVEDSIWQANVLKTRLATQDQLAAMAKALRKWGNDQDAVYSIMCGQIILRNSQLSNAKSGMDVITQ